MPRKFTVEELDKILQSDKHAQRALKSLERAGFELDRFLRGKLLSIANAPHSTEYMRHLHQRSRGWRRVWFVPILANGKARLGEYRALPELTKWNERILRALPSRVCALADQVELAISQPNVGIFIWIGSAPVQVLELPQRMRDFAGLLREALSHRWLHLRMSVTE